MFTGNGRAFDLESRVTHITYNDGYSAVRALCEVRHGLHLLERDNIEPVSCPDCISLARHRAKTMPKTVYKVTRNGHSIFVTRPWALYYHQYCITLPIQGSIFAYDTAYAARLSMGRDTEMWECATSCYEWPPVKDAPSQMDHFYNFWTCIEEHRWPGDYPALHLLPGTVWCPDLMPLERIQ